MDFSRRSLLGGALGAGGAMALTSGPAMAQAPVPPAPAVSTAGAGDTKFSIDLLGQPNSLLIDGSWLKEAGPRNFPVSTGVSGALLSMAPGALRELHWHAQAAEWAYVISGRCRVSLVDPAGHSQTVDFGRGDTWYFPRGFGHSIQCLGPEDCVFLLAFDDGHSTEYGTFSLTDWMAHVPKTVLAKTFDVPVQTFDGFAQKNAFFAAGKSPPPLPAEPKPGSLNEGPLSCRYPLLAQRPSATFKGGTIRLASARQFPISTTMTGALITIEPGAVRPPHWHPNANEWQYVVSGTARTTLFLSKGQTAVAEMGKGHVAYVPRGCGHYTENVGTEPVEMVTVFDEGTYQVIEMTDWVRSNTADLLATNFQLSPQAAGTLLR